VQFALQAPVLLLQLLDRTLPQASGRQRRQLLLPVFEALGADPQLPTDLGGGLAALEPHLDGRPFEVLVVSLVLARTGVLVVHGVVFSSHNHPTLVHQIGTRPVSEKSLISRMPCFRFWR
jgi:hypothetical protein